MFYSHDLLLQPDSVFFVIWQYATHRGSKLDRQKILSQDVPKVCKSIEMMIPSVSTKVNSRNNSSLYLLAQLTYGITLVFSKQVDYLLKDGEKLKDILLRSNLIMQKWKELEKEEKRRRSKQIQNVDEDDVDLEHLDQISNRIGINSNFNDITLPEEQIRWEGTDQVVDDLMYGVGLEMNSHSLLSTFVDGRSSDEKDVLHDIEGFEVFPKEQEGTLLFPDTITQPIAEESNIPATTMFDDTLINFPPEERIHKVIPEMLPNEMVAQHRMVEEVQELDEEPPQKKRRVTEEPKEVHREQAPSRPVTPRLDQSTVQKELYESTEKSFELDSNLVPNEEIARPLRKKKIQHVDLQLDLEDIKLMQESYSKLVHSTEELKVKIQPESHLNLKQLFDPSPFFILNKKFPEFLRVNYGSAKYREIGTFARYDDENLIWSEEDETDENLIFAKTFLFSPKHRTLELNEETMVYQNTLIPPMPEEFFPLNPQELESMNVSETEKGRCRKSSGVLEEGRKKQYEALTFEPIYEPVLDRDPFVLSSGSLINTRLQTEDCLLDELDSCYPDWLNFNQFVSTRSRKQAACGFMFILSALKDQTITVRQEDCFANIYIRKVMEEVSTMSMNNTL